MGENTCLVTRHLINNSWKLDKTLQVTIEYGNTETKKHLYTTNAHIACPSKTSLCLHLTNTLVIVKSIIIMIGSKIIFYIRQIKAFNFEVFYLEVFIHIKLKFKIVRHSILPDCSYFF